ncbi:DUF6059 family protein [Phytohabitans sp. ZYX-F-186]|uniref:DUF6059 family protein n=1 Tax=Phytohabitans maris TaxID=3071409 RepID=A0ABU0ZK20_9ACTN|nr:DUF6059 family protein [Phytohabitans sp. ZYX-F-186]MDQ7907406.1 DUF6059 family protein [Phytohabitans sp. ZYX-F-186]
MDGMCESCPRRRRSVRHRLWAAVRFAAEYLYDGLIVVGYSMGPVAPVQWTRRGQWRRGPRRPAKQVPVRGGCPCQRPPAGDAGPMPAHPERVTPGVAPSAVERRLWSQLDPPR